MLVKVSEAEGTVLDWLVAVCLGHGPVFNMHSHGLIWSGWWLSTAGEYRRMPSYSTDWEQGGPIIERERIDLLGMVNGPSGDWTASAPRANMVGWRHIAGGPTPLIAAMRCYVTTKLGDVVEVPERL